MLQYPGQARTVEGKNDISHGRHIVMTVDREREREAIRFYVMIHCIAATCLLLLMYQRLFLSHILSFLFNCILFSGVFSLGGGGFSTSGRPLRAVNKSSLATRGRVLCSVACNLIHKKAILPSFFFYYIYDGAKLCLRSQRELT